MKQKTKTETKTELVKTIKFALFFLMIFSILFIIADYSQFNKWFALQEARTTTDFLNSIGIKAELFEKTQWPVIAVKKFNAEISGLCTGLMELLVLISLIIASIGIPWKKRMIGIIAATIIAIGFNFFRLIITIQLLLQTNIKTVELAHDVLFRASLFIAIAGIYSVWFYWAVKTTNKNRSTNLNN